MRTPLTLDEEWFNAARDLARTSGRRLGVVVEERLQGGQKPRSPASRRAAPLLRMTEPDQPPRPDGPRVK